MTSTLSGIKTSQEFTLGGMVIFLVPLVPLLCYHAN